MADFSQVQEVLTAINSVVVGKPSQVKQAVCCVLAGGHLLIEDVPGVGKTTLAHALAAAFGLDYSRVQFTGDLMPSDLSGSAFLRPDRSGFEFRPGPIFNQVVLADELNRAPPRTQSALLEAMEERSVTVDGQSHALPLPFFVIATQNPATQVGVFPLPESQLDRFLMVLSLGYPDAEHEEELLQHPSSNRRRVERPVLEVADLVRMHAAIAALHVSPALAKYVRALANATRSEPFTQGLSPRAALALVGAAKAWAAIEGSDVVLPEHVQAVFLAVSRHRIKVRAASNDSVDSHLAEVLQKTPV